jgi:hypothetical protein
MKASVTRIYEIKFQVRDLSQDSSEIFGGECNELSDALTMLDLARATKPGFNWHIVCDTTVPKK